MNEISTEKSQETVYENWKDGWRKVFIFSGRASRTQYWSFTSANIIIFIFLNVISIYLPAIGGPTANFLAQLSIFIIPLISVVFLLITIPITVRRLHDMNASGLWLLILLIPIINGFFAIALFVATFIGPVEPNKYDTKINQK